MEQLKDTDFEEEIEFNLKDQLQLIKTKKEEFVSAQPNTQNKPNNNTTYKLYNIYREYIKRYNENFSTGFEESEIAAKMAEKYYITTYNNTIYGLIDDKWVELKEGEYGNLMPLIRKTVEKDLKKAKYEEIISQIKIQSYKITTEEELPILFKNGYIYNANIYLYKEGLVPFSPYYIDIEYKEDAKRIPIVDEFLNNITNADEDYIKVLIEILGYSFITNHVFKGAFSKFFFLVGDGGNGKGTLLKVFTKVIGRNNCTHLSHKEIADERYLNTMKGKLANFGDDVPNTPLKDDVVKYLKNISSCDEITIRQLYKNAESARIISTLVFTSNHLLKSWEKDYAFKRRIIWLPINYKPKKYDPQFLDKLTTKEALEYWFYLAVQGYFRLYKNKQFTQSATIDTFTNSYHKENNNIEMYLEEKLEEEFIDKKPKDAYDLYTIWAENEGVEALGQKTFINTVIVKYNLEVGPKRINGTVSRLFKQKMLQKM